MDKFINLPFLLPPEIEISNEQAYDYLLKGAILKYQPYKNRNVFVYVKKDPESNYVFIFSENKLFKPAKTFLVSRNKKSFLNSFTHYSVFFI